MKSTVYFVRVNDKDGPTIRQEKFARLLTQSTLLSFITKDQKVAVKMHFGEEGNTGFVKPSFVRQLCLDIRGRGAHPFVSDTNTLYHGRRIHSDDHLSLAAEHGFTDEAVGAPVTIADDSIEGGTADVRLGGRYIGVAKVAALFRNADALVGVAHFKGHIMTGFGGALKNIGMGCASREGKLQQHSDISPVISREACVGCSSCVAVCPAGAIRIVDEKARIDAKACIGCASCIAVCGYGAIEIEWESGGSTIQQKMVEYAEAALKGKKGKQAYVNFAVTITKECDCLAKDDPSIVPDIGILASLDPVALDAASFGLVVAKAGRDIFNEVHPKRDGALQLRYAQERGLGSMEYELKEFS